MKTLVAFLKRYWLIVFILLDMLWVACELFPSFGRFTAGWFWYALDSAALLATTSVDAVLNLVVYGITLLDVRKWGRTEYFVVSGVTLPLWFSIRAIPAIKLVLKQSKQKKRHLPSINTKPPEKDNLDRVTKLLLDKARHRR